MSVTAYDGPAIIRRLLSNHASRRSAVSINVLVRYCTLVSINDTPTQRHRARVMVNAKARERPLNDAYFIRLEARFQPNI